MRVVGRVPACLMQRGPAPRTLTSMCTMPRRCRKARPRATSRSTAHICSTESARRRKWVLPSRARPEAASRWRPPTPPPADSPPSPPFPSSSSSSPSVVRLPSDPESCSESPLIASNTWWPEVADSSKAPAPAGAPSGAEGVARFRRGGARVTRGLAEKEAAAASLPTSCHGAATPHARVGAEAGPVAASAAGPGAAESGGAAPKAKACGWGRCPVSPRPPDSVSGARPAAERAAARARAATPLVALRVAMS